jgi:hypothetical protein
MKVSIRALGLHANHTDEDEPPLEVVSQQWFGRVEKYRVGDGVDRARGPVEID